MNKLSELYNSGKTLSEISKLTDIPTSTVYYKIKQTNNMRPRGPNAFIDKQEIKKLYIRGLSCNEIASKLLVSSSRIYKILKNFYPHIIRSRSESLRDNNIDHTFFKKYHRESCYWAGFIAADGNIQKANRKQSNLISISLRVSDCNHLEKLGIMIGCKNVKIHKNVASIRFSSKEMALDLAKFFSIVPNKSLVLKPPILPDNVLVHFIRGYIDGDGWIEKSRPTVGVLGTYNMLEWIKSNIKRNCDVGNPTIRKENNIFSLAFGGSKQTPKILKWLYEGSTTNTRLDRKYNIAKSKYNIGELIQHV